MHEIGPPQSAAGRSAQDVGTAAAWDHARWLVQRLEADDHKGVHRFTGVR